MKQPDAEPGPVDFFWSPKEEILLRGHTLFLSNIFVFLILCEYFLFDPDPNTSQHNSKSGSVPS